MRDLAGVTAQVRVGREARDLRYDVGSLDLGEAVLDALQTLLAEVVVLIEDGDSLGAEIFADVVADDLALGEVAGEYGEDVLCFAR